MDNYFVRSHRVRTTLRAAVDFRLSPSDIYLGLTFSGKRAVFLSSQLDWGKLCNALERIATVCPPLCGRYICTDGSDHSVRVEPNSENGFGFVETEVDASLAAIRSSRHLLSNVERIDTHMNWPYFLERATEDPIVNDTGSVFGVHLTRAKDGCVLSFSARHFVLDGARGASLIGDVSRAYRGLEIAEKHLDRSIMWPEAFLTRFSFPGHSPEKYPSRFVERSAAGLRSFYSQSASELEVAQLHVPQETISQMKSMTKDRLQGVEYVSTNDLMSALCWMLRAEFKAKEHPVSPSSLGIQGTRARFPMDTSTSCMPVVPENYLGNALATFVADYPSEELPEVASFIEILARAASVLRQVVHAAKTESEAVLEGLLRPYTITCTSLPNPLGKAISVVTTQDKMPFDGIDFGDGASQYVFMPIDSHCPNVLSCVEVNPNGDGVLMYLAVTKTERAIMESSSLLKECAPGAEILPEQMTEQDATNIMKL